MMRMWFELKPASGQVAQQFYPTQMLMQGMRQGPAAPLGGMMTAENVAEAAISLAALPHVTGAELRVDGGLTAW